MVFVSIPVALIGGVYSLYFYNVNFSVAVAVGFIALFGVAVSTGVLMISYLNDTVKKFYSHALVHLHNKNIIKENISYLTQEDFLLFVGSLPDEDKISYINKNIF